MRINTSTHYAICMMQYLAANKRIVSSTELSGSVKISQRYSMQIISKLRDGGLISTTIGMSGGYTLLKDPSAISIYDIVLLMEGDVITHQANNDEGYLSFNDALCLLRDYVGSYMKWITLDKLSSSTSDSGLVVLMDITEAHIADLKEKTEFT